MEDVYPALVAAETVDLLTRVGSLRAVRTTPVATAEALADAVRATQASALVIVAHGERDGLRVAGATLSWDALRGALAGSAAQDVFVGACHSAALGEVEGKRVWTTFEGVVDYRLVAPTIAWRMHVGILPALDPAFERAFDAYIADHGGLGAYATLVLFPQYVLAEVRDECTVTLDEWYKGNVPQSEMWGCVFHIDRGNINCYTPSNRNDPEGFCYSFTPEEQQAWNKEAAAPTAGPDWFPECEPGAQWECLFQVFDFDPQAGSNGRVHIRVGIIDHGLDDCYTVFTLHPPFVQGALRKVVAKVFKNLPAARSFTKESGSTTIEEPSFGLRLCGSFDGSAQLNSRHEASFEGSGRFDIRLSGRTQLSETVRVFGREWTIHFGIEGGLKYPISVEAKAHLRKCPGVPAFEFTGDARVHGEGVEGFAQGILGFGEVGGKWNFGGAFTFDMALRRYCKASGESASGESIGHEAPAVLPLPPLGDTYARLVDARLAVQNPEPTLVQVTQDGTEKYLTAALVELVPGHGDFNHYAQTGVLARLGIPEDLPAGNKVLLDLTQRRVLDALGMEDQPEITPRVSLVDGVAVVPAGTPSGQAQETFCRAPPGVAPILESKACERVDLGPLATTSAATSGPGCTPYAEITGSPEDEPAGTVEEEDEYTYSTRGGAEGGSPGATCEGIMEIAHEGVSAGIQTTCSVADVAYPGFCLRQSEVAGKLGTITTHWLMDRIHQAWYTLDRGDEEIIAITTCAAETVPVEGTGSCLANSAYGPFLKDPAAAALEYTQGNALLAEYTLVIEEHMRQEAMYACNRMIDIMIWVLFGYGSPIGPLPPLGLPTIPRPDDNVFDKWGGAGVPAKVHRGGCANYKSIGEIQEDLT